VLHAACKGGHLQIVQYVFEQSDFGINAVDQVSLLFCIAFIWNVIACCFVINGTLEHAVQLCIAVRGAKMDILAKYNKLPLHYACCTTAACCVIYPSMNHWEKW